MNTRTREVTVKVKENDALFKVDSLTGEMAEVQEPKRNALPEGKELHSFKEFYKGNLVAMRFLSTVLTTEELGVVNLMIMRAGYGNNSLVPLNDESSARELERELGVNKSRVKKVMDRLFSFGVYAHIKVAGDTMSEYWVLNPYISWRGRLMDTALGYYFRETVIGKICSK